MFESFVRFPFVQEIVDCLIVYFEHRRFEFVSPTVDKHHVKKYIHRHDLIIKRQNSFTPELYMPLRSCVLKYATSITLSPLPSPSPPKKMKPIPLRRHFGRGVEDLFDASWNHAHALVIVVIGSFHGVRLARTGLAVGKHADAVKIGTGVVCL